MAGTAEQPELSPSALQGHTLNGVYEVEEKLAHGGMAWVYRARHIRFGTSWAVKILFPHHAENTSIRERFLRESHIQHQLTHPHIVRVHDLIEERGVCGYVMEWCGEGDLRHLLRGYRGPLPLGQVAGLFEKIVSGVEYAHKRGIVHRDLKPENILITRQDEVYLPKITDFGIAKLLEGTGHTDTGSTIGTFSFMPPEQFLDAKDVDERSDIYSLGVILYLLTSGRLPFKFDKGSQGTFFNMVLRVQHEQPPPIEGLAEALQGVIMRCLEKKPEDRFASAEQLLQAFVAACEASGVVEEPLRKPPVAPQVWESELRDFSSVDTTNPLPTQVLSAADLLSPTELLEAEPTAALSVDDYADEALVKQEDSQDSVSPFLPQGNSLSLAGETTPPSDEGPTRVQEIPAGLQAEPKSRGPALWGGLGLLVAMMVGVGLWWGGNSDPSGSVEGPVEPSVDAARMALSPRPRAPMPRRIKPAKAPMSPAEIKTSNASIKALASFLQKQRWRKAMASLQTLLKIKLDDCMTAKLYAATAIAFPEESVQRLNALTQRRQAHKRKPCRIELAALAKKATARKAEGQPLYELAARFRALRAAAKQQTSFPYRQRRLVAAIWRKGLKVITRHPTATGPQLALQQIRDQLAQALPSVGRALTWSRGLLEEAASAQKAGLLAWRRFWAPRLYTVQQLEAHVQQLTTLSQAWRWAQRHLRDFNEGRFASLARHNRLWRTLYQPMLKGPGRQRHLAQISTLLARPIALFPSLELPLRYHNVATRALKRQRFARSLKFFQRFQARIKALRELKSATRDAWLHAIDKAKLEIQKTLFRHSVDAVKRKQWQEAVRLCDQFLKLFPKSIAVTEIRKRRSYASDCARSGFCQ